MSRVELAPALHADVCLLLPPVHLFPDGEPKPQPSNDLKNSPNFGGRLGGKVLLCPFQRSGLRVPFHFQPPSSALFTLSAGIRPPQTPPSCPFPTQMRIYVAGAFSGKTSMCLLCCKVCLSPSAQYREPSPHLILITTKYPGTNEEKRGTKVMVFVVCLAVVVAVCGL